ncbi:MAG: hemerythrin domain-containing protein [Solirubrobacterales bacterium]
MKRSEALRSLSRDHHQALVVAQGLRRTSNAAEAAGAFLQFWKQSGESHFRVEEEVLLPCWALLGTVDDQAAARLAREHLSIRAKALALESRTATLEEISSLGEELEAHVRFEERELFALLEENLGDEELEQLARVVSEAETQPA